MAFDTTFTLYRKYNTVCDDKTYDEIVKRYVESYKNGIHASKDKSDDAYLADLPPVLEWSYSLHTSEYDEVAGTWKDIADHSISGQRKTYSAILLEDKRDLDELLSWSFGSSFTSIYDELNMGNSGPSSTIKVIDKCTANEILQAVKYLLGGEYSDKFEHILENKWIKILAEGGNSGDQYYKYVFRNDKKALKEALAENTDNSAEYCLLSLKNVLETYVNVDKDYSRPDSTELILVYSGGN